MLNVDFLPFMNKIAALKIPVIPVIHVIGILINLCSRVYDSGSDGLIR